MSTYSADQDPIADSTLEALAAELAAMQAIANALSCIRERETRLRVLSWAQERFSVMSQPEPPPIHAAASCAENDEDPLSVNSLAEFFEPSRQGDSFAAQALAAHAWSAEAEPTADTRPAEDVRPLHRLARRVADGLELLVGEWLTA